MHAGLVPQRTHWICARCLNSVGFWAGTPTRPCVPQFPSSIRNSRLNSTLTIPPADGTLPTNHEIVDVRDEQGRGPVPLQRKSDITDVLVDDLDATLEAHRNANPVIRIRKVQFNSLGFGNKFKPLTPLSTETNGSAPPKKVQGSDLEDAALLASPPFTSFRPIGLGAGVYAIPPGRDWYCLWKSTSGPTFGAIQQPWMKYVLAKEVDPWLRLGEDIRAFEKYMTPDPEEEASVQKLIAHVKEIVARVVPSGELIVHGSRYTKLAGPLSDIDFCLSLPEHEKFPLERGPTSYRSHKKTAARELLWKVHRALRPIARKRSMEFIHARIPLVSAVDKVTGLSLQVSTLAPYLPAREYTMLYLSEFPSLRPLYILLRHSLLIRQFTDVHEGGLGSYPLLIMIVTALKHAGTRFERDDLGRQLLHVLEFWAVADVETNAYSADPPRIFKKIKHKGTLTEREEHSSDPVLKGMDLIRKRKESHPWLLCLQDPGDPKNDLGKNALLIERVQSVFSHAYRSIAKNVAYWETISDGRRESFSFLDSLIRAKYDNFVACRQVVSQGSRVARVLPPVSKLDLSPSKEGAK